MKIGVFTVLFGQKSLPEALDYVAECGVEAVEIGTGAYPGNAHANLDKLLGSAAALKEFKNAIESRDLVISALSCHGNPIHPDKKIAKDHHDTFVKTCKLAKKLDVPRVVTFSGCPGDSPAAKYPNWVTCPWPDDFLKILNWQWDKVVIPYWKKAAAIAKDNGVSMICLEMHPGFVVHSTQTLMKLRLAVGDIIGANFDPSHLFWQGMDPVASIRALEGAIYHFHAKDVKIDPYNTAENGVLDTKPYSDEINRSWIFRTVGYGHDQAVWKDIISTLKMIEYDWVLSIEHEDSLMSVNEGFKKAVAFLQDVVISEESGAMWWA